MQVFFVRHGETNGNAGLRHQHSNTKLNDKGVEQAKKVAREIKKLKPTHIISSTNIRALDTAKIITEEITEVTIDTHPAFRELERPDWLIGNHYLSIITFQYIWNWFFGGETEGGESYQDFVRRIEEAKKHLENYPEDSRILVITHSIFTIHFVDHIKSGKSMNFGRAVINLFRVLLLKNTAITHFEFAPIKDKKQWCLGKCPTD